MMKWDIGDCFLLIIVVISLMVLVFVLMQSGKMDDCYKRGGRVVDTSAGWVCAKLEKV
jgi:preprotein translocase subunit SecG